MVEMVVVIAMAVARWLGRGASEKKYWGSIEY